MKEQLTKEQSQHLIELGVPKDKASRCISEGGNSDVFRVDGGYITKRGTVYSIFTLIDLLEILPKEIKNRNDINMEWHSLMECYVVGYGSIETSRRFAKELIDALYELACWYYGVYLKSEKK